VIRVGSCSWTDPTLIKHSDFYPKGVRTPEQRLRCYSQRFPIVEVDATYYRLPDEATAAAWDERTPAGFVFDIKAYALLTLHPAPAKSLPVDVREAVPEEARQKRNLYLRDLPAELQAEVWQRFTAGLRPLHEAGKLGAVLLQFPPWVFPSHESRDHIEAARHILSDYRVAVEFRHGSWVNDKNRERTLDFLREQRASYVCVDEPQGFRTSVPPLLAVTNPDLAVVRFHGHNAETWQAKGINASERFRYLYSQEELEGWRPKLEDLSKQAHDTHALMNNCYRDYSMRNAAQLADLLRDLPHQPAIGVTT